MAIDGTTPGGQKPGTNNVKATGIDISWDEGPHYLNKIAKDGSIIQVRIGGSTGAKSRVKDDRGPQKARAKNQSASKKRKGRRWA